MRHYYDDAYWDARRDRLVRLRSGFAWGTFFAGIIIGAILF